MNKTFNAWKDSDILEWHIVHNKGWWPIPAKDTAGQRQQWPTMPQLDPMCLVSEAWIAVHCSLNQKITKQTHIKSKDANTSSGNDMDFAAYRRPPSSDVCLCWVIDESEVTQQLDWFHHQTQAFLITTGQNWKKQGSLVNWNQASNLVIWNLNRHVAVAWHVAVSKQRTFCHVPQSGIVNHTWPIRHCQSPVLR